MGSINTACTDAVQRASTKFLHLGFEDILACFFHLVIKLFWLVLAKDVAGHLPFCNLLQCHPSALWTCHNFQFTRIYFSSVLRFLFLICFCLVHCQFLLSTVRLLPYALTRKVQPTNISPLFSLLLHSLCWDLWKKTFSQQIHAFFL